MARRRTRGPRNQVVLKLLSDEGAVVEELVVDYDTYYEESVEVIDRAHRRVQMGVRKILGTIYDSSGRVQEDFENTYDESGALRRSRGVHRDGTVTEFQV